MLKKTDPTRTKIWKKIKAHSKTMKKNKMRHMFEKDPKRFSKFNIKFEDILFDYSKNIIIEETISCFLELCREVKLREAIESMFAGERINETEDRSVLHVALRDIEIKEKRNDVTDVQKQVLCELKKIGQFSDRLISGKMKGYTGKRITDIINIGIGGSDLGPAMVTEALTPYKKGVRSHFVSNVDGSDIVEALKKVSPETTVFIIASKTFTTQETMTNAATAKKWFLRSAKKKDRIKKHFVAVSTNKEKVCEFGILPDNMFTFWDWVGGRYSLWSAIGLSISCAVGHKNFLRLLEGAHAMDVHFRTAEFDRNIPVLMALLGVWYNNFFDCDTCCILPYDQYLRRFPAYLQQADMESNGKSVGRNGKAVNYSTGPVVWGEPGTNGQHAFYQLIHQGTKIVPCDFIAPILSHNAIGDHHKILLSNFFAQTEALMKGKNAAEVAEELKRAGLKKSEIKKMVPFKVFEGNKPTNTILVKKITPKVLGSLIAMYEHKIFTQGVIWNIFSFDQWGVELGKQLAKNILPSLKKKKLVQKHDPSTEGLIRYFNKTAKS